MRLTHFSPLASLARYGLLILAMVCATTTLARAAGEVTINNPSTGDTVTFTGSQLSQTVKFTVTDGWSFSSVKVLGDDGNGGFTNYETITTCQVVNKADGTYDYSTAEISRRAATGVSIKVTVYQMQMVGGQYVAVMKSATITGLTLAIQ